MKQKPDIKEIMPLPSEAASPTEPTAIKVTPQHPYAKGIQQSNVPGSATVWQGYVILG